MGWSFWDDTGQFGVVNTVLVGRIAPENRKIGPGHMLYGPQFCFGENA